MITIEKDGHSIPVVFSHWVPSLKDLDQDGTPIRGVILLYFERLVTRPDDKEILGPYVMGYVRNRFVFADEIKMSDPSEVKRFKDIMARYLGFNYQTAPLVRVGSKVEEHEKVSYE